MLIPTTVLTQTGVPVDLEVAYAQITSPVTITATSSGSPNDIISAGALSFDGATEVCVEFYSPAVVGAGGSQQTYLVLWDGATELGRMVQVGNAGVVVAPALARRILTPSAGSHEFKIRGWKDGGTSSVQAGPGGSNQQLPAYIRITLTQGSNNALLPWTIDIAWPTTAATRTGWNTLSSDAGEIGGFQYGGTAQNDEVGWDVVLAAGTWTLSLYCVTHANGGIITVYLDGSSVGTIDTYTAGGLANQHKTITGISVASTGKKRLLLKVETKNGSSGGFSSSMVVGVPLRLLRTA